MDVWALGCLLYTLAFQKHPFDTESPLQAISGLSQVHPGSIELPLSPFYASRSKQPNSGILPSSHTLATPPPLDTSQPVPATPPSPPYISTCPCYPTLTPLHLKRLFSNPQHIHLKLCHPPSLTSLHLKVLPLPQILNCRWNFPEKSFYSPELHGLIISCLSSEPGTRPTIFELTERAAVALGEKMAEELTSKPRDAMLMKVEV